MDDVDVRECKEVAELIEDAKKRLESISEREWQAYIGMSESNKHGEAGEACDDIFYSLDCAIDCLGRAGREMRRAMGD